MNMILLKMKVGDQDMMGKFVKLVQYWLMGTFQELPYAPIKDAKKDFFDTGYTFQNSVALSGGGENSTYSLFSSIN